MKTILALQPDARQVGYAVFKEGTLTNWGAQYLGSSTPLPQRVHRIAMPFFRTLLDRHAPDVVVLPHPTKIFGTARNRFLRAIRYELARAPGTVTSFGRREIQHSFKELLNVEKINKDQIMRALVKWFPELLRYLPKPRRLWDSEDYWTPMFDAVSLAITFLHNND
jgi:hypothetical protein